MLLISIVLRTAFGLQQIVTERHLDMLAQLLLAFALIRLLLPVRDVRCLVLGRRFERQTLYARWSGTYAWTYWAAVACTLAAPQALWFKAVRRNARVLALVAFLVTVGVWLGHFTEVANTLSRDYLPSAWQVYVPSVWEWLLLAGMIGLWFFLFFLFVRLLPMISIFELKEALHADRQEG